MSDSEKDTSGVDQLPSGRWRIRWRDGGRRKSKVFDTKDEAQRVLNAVRYVLWERYQSAQSQPKEITLRTHGAAWLDRRELAGHRAIATDRSFWRVNPNRRMDGVECMVDCPPVLSPVKVSLELPPT